jgi:hypothetical protein
MSFTMHHKNPAVKIVTSSGGRRLKVRGEVRNEQENPVSTTSRSIQLRQIALTEMEGGQEIGPAVSQVTTLATEMGTQPEAKPK